MSIYEYDEELHMKTVREEGFEDGELSGTIKTYYKFGWIIPDIAKECNISEERVKEILHIESDLEKIPSARHISVDELSEAELNAELEKGYADMVAGRTKPARQHTVM